MDAQNLACREAQRRTLLDRAPVSSRKVVATWHVGGSPDMLQVSSDGAQLWASNRFDGSVSVIDTRTGHVLHVIRTGIKPHGLAYFPQPGRYSMGHNGVYR
jgi:YVTN family beta-propeller protein